MIRTFDGHTPDIADSAYIDDSAVVIGDVTIEADASVWPNAVVRGDHGPIVLREGTNVQDNATIHEGTQIGPYATVGHNAIVHNATIETRATVGMGAVVLDGSVVGEESIVGANSLVTADTSIPESMLAVGTPAEVVREINDSDLATTADRYVEYKERHRKTSSVIQLDGHDE